MKEYFAFYAKVVRCTSEFSQTFGESPMKDVFVCPHRGEWPAGIGRSDLFIEGRLRLKVNAAKSAVARPEERHFVGLSRRPMPEEVRVVDRTVTLDAIQEAYAYIASGQKTGNVVLKLIA
ncbi:hypothetical protein [Sorangium atrum]|uniref:Alcohol dehydrogenase n=1 Tax=Sorangium atrum TaxID=2995308 RepID=A0ABT5C9J1_9BACT|nr:hypothetical protein [Sorangium aterium]MDC0683045.1 hypothetical protein [Sorangium aterium]